MSDAGGDGGVQEQAKYGDIIFLRKGSGVGYRSIVYKVRSPLPLLASASPSLPAYIELRDCGLPLHIWKKTVPIRAPAVYDSSVRHAGCT